MSKWREPVGAKPKSVYVRRRLAVLAALLAIIAFIVLVIVQPGSSGGAAEAPEVDVPGEIASAEEPTAAADVADCAKGDLTITPIVDKESYAAGELPQLSLSITNKGDAECQADLGTAGMVFVVTSGSDEVWVSTDCQTSPDHRAVILQAGQTLTTEAIEWDRTRSSTETCDISRDPVAADGATYHLSVTAAGVVGDGTAPFLLY